MTFLDCGCCLRDGRITRCPRHEAELEKGFADSVSDNYPTYAEMLAEIRRDDGTQV